jgi:hypothetical protein
LPAVTVCFQAFAIGSGWLATALVEGRPLVETAGRFLDLANPWLALLSLAKGALTGAADRHHRLPSGQQRRGLGPSHFRCRDHFGRYRTGRRVRHRRGLRGIGLGIGMGMTAVATITAAIEAGTCCCDGAAIPAWICRSTRAADIAWWWTMLLPQGAWWPPSRHVPRWASCPGAAACRAR